MILIACFPLKAATVDLGIAALSIQLNGSLNSIGSYTVDALVFVGPNLGLVIGGQTVAQILATDLGTPESGSFAFNFPGAGGSGTLENGTSAVSLNGIGNVTISPGTWMVTSFSGPSPDPTGNSVSNFNVFDPGSIVQTLRAGGVPLRATGFGTNIAPSVSSVTSDPLLLGVNGGTTYIAEVRESVYSVRADFAPEPSTAWMVGGLLLTIATGGGLCKWSKMRSPRRV